jgi:hypothetical protein
MPIRTRIFLLAALVFASGALTAVFTGIPSAMAVSTAFVAAATWAFGPRVGVLVLVGEQFVAVPILASIQTPGGIPPTALLMPVVLNDSLMLIAVAALRRAELRQAASEAALLEKNDQLETALAEVKELRGMLPICAWCKNVRDVNGMWDRLEEYLSKHSHATFTHSICPTCLAKMTAEANELPKSG